MIHFDIRTGLQIVALLYVVLPVVTWLALAKQRSPQVILWCGGGLIFAVCALLTSLYGQVSDWISLVLVVLLMLLTLFAKWQSLLLDLGKPLKTRSMAAAIAAIMLVFSILHFGLMNYTLRAQFISLVVAGLCFAISRTAWQIWRTERSQSARWLTLTYAMLCAAFFYRALSVMLQHAVNPVMMADGGGSQFVMLAALLTSVLGNFAYVGMALDRSVRREIVAAGNLARDEERRRLEQQIAQLDRQRSLGQMSAALGHELKQPLTAILTNSQVLKQAVGSDFFNADAQQQIIDKIVHNTQRANQIIERIRDYIRPSPLRRHRVDLCEVVREALELVEAEARKCRVGIRSHARPAALLILGDRIQISQILLNVLRNAIEALADKPQRRIELTCRAENGQAVVSVSDSGPGFPAAMLDQQILDYYTTKSTGLGMGLSISKLIAEQHGGTLRIRNAAPEHGSGAVVELLLPLHTDAATGGQS